MKWLFGEHKLIRKTQRLRDMGTNVYRLYLVDGTQVHAILAEQPAKGDVVQLHYSFRGQLKEVTVHR